MSAAYRSWEQKPYESIYLHAQTIIDHPIEKVWPCALDIGRWMNAHRLETLAGESGRVGYFERVYPRGLGEQWKESRASFSATIRSQRSILWAVDFVPRGPPTIVSCLSVEGKIYQLLATTNHPI